MIIGFDVDFGEPSILQIGNGGAAGSMPGIGPVTNQGVLLFNRSGLLTVSNGIHGGGADHEHRSGPGDTGRSRHVHERSRCRQQQHDLASECERIRQHDRRGGHTEWCDV